MSGESYRVLHNELIKLSDGRRLTAKIWLPNNAENQPVPAILEYLPYRKRDGTAPRDDSNYPLFARAGYAGVRVDISGTGESDGDFDDEYSQRELLDGVEVIAWIIRQPWCSGSVGMMGISWGGFNSLQIAALRPEGLKAIISIGSTVDRYNDDIHYKNGCHLYSNFLWSSTMLCYASRPPDPELVGEDWRHMWLHRLKTQPFPLETWLEHQRRDKYWKHGSICEDYSAIQIPSLVISGWSDGYKNAPSAMAAHGQGQVAAINGPWIHKYPHFAWPKPRMDFHSEAIKWWDRWLKGVENDAENTPAYRAYISENVRPGGCRDYEEGHWVAESCWPSTTTDWCRHYLAPGAQLQEEPSHEEILPFSSPQDCGIACGEIFTLKPDSELPGDQRVDDAVSCSFETGILSDPLTILGRPKITLNLSIDKPLGNVIVRLIDVHPDGVAHRVSWGALNLSHRNGNEKPVAMVPGKVERVTIELDECGYRFLSGNRLRVSISTAYWPMIMPPPESVTAKLHVGSDTFIDLPIRTSAEKINVPEPLDLDPLPDYLCHSKPDHCRTVEKDLQNNLTHYKVFDDTGNYEVPDCGICTRHTHDECWTISPSDPLTSSAKSTYICYMSRGEWSIKTVSQSSFHCDPVNYYIKASVRAYDGETLLNERHWKKTIARDHT